MRDYSSDLALLQNEMDRLRQRDINVSNPSVYTVNPVLSLLKVSWKGLPNILEKKDPDLRPEPGEEYVVIWKNPHDSKIYIRSASNEDLLAIKLIAEDHDMKHVSSDTNVTISYLKEVIRNAADIGLIIRPRSRIRREKEFFGTGIDEEYLISDVFTLQWHITQACDFNCRHCYDRTDRKRLTFDMAIKVLDDLYDFSEEMNVDSSIFFSGGNPFLHPRFPEIYEEAVKRGFEVAILGNPVSREQFEAIVRIKKPAFYQVSLEGLEAHNDYMRGKGHFEKTLHFLELLDDLDIYSVVMLTLTRDNMNQVIPLTDVLSDKADSFTFNRLSLVGKGVLLHLPEQGDYIGFLKDYLRKCHENNILRLKDNIINILRFKNGEDLFGGCTGFGCGAAFNFVALTPDGEVHACRKFPSYLGNIFSRSLMEIYTSKEADEYRKGPSECRGCPIRAVCRGCLAMAYSCGLDIFKNRDPFCFIGKELR